MHRTNFEQFQRYHTLMSDKKAFYRIIRQPLNSTFWANTLRISPQHLERILADEDIEIQPIPWRHHGYELQSSIKLGNHWLNQAGFIQIQEAAAMIPMLALQPKPGETNLDLCAAPGNKTAEMAVAMNNQGTLIANDRNVARVRALGKMVKRACLINTLITQYDGCNYPRCGEFFDKVMVDVPCSCEGTIRKQPRLELSLDKITGQTSVQQALLDKALQLTKPGGYVCYATCTFAPEENERVLQQVLSRYGEAVSLQPVELPNLYYSPGIVQWQGQHFDEQLRHAIRIWPEQNNTGGFFTALLQKHTSTQKRTSITKPLDEQPEAMTLMKAHAQSRFHIADSELARFVYLRLSHKGVYATNRRHALPNALSFDMIGAMALKTKHRYPKLTTVAANLLEPWIQNNKLAVTRTQLTQYMDQQQVILDLEQLTNVTGLGYVVVTYQHLCVGIGFVFCRNHQWILKSMFPKKI